MIGFEIKETSIIAWSYRWMTGKEELPQSLCTVFWTVAIFMDIHGCTFTSVLSNSITS